MSRLSSTPEEAKKKKRLQSKKRNQQLRNHNKDNGGENISGPIDKSTVDDLNTLLLFHQRSNPKASKIGTIRWAIRFAADALRKEGKIE